MASYMMQATLRTVDNIPANFVQNQFGVEVTGVDLDTDAMVAAIKDFYDDVNPSIFASVIAQNGHLIKFYEKPGLTPNYPIAELPFNLAAAPSGASQPSEVALVLSFQGDRAPGFPQARRRGRIYIGPLATTVNSVGRPDAPRITQLATAGATLRANIAAVPGHLWSIWSTVDQQMVEVTDGWVDNAFDTQRRRGVATTSRTTWT